MKRLENRYLLALLTLLIAVGQMTQTIYVPVVADIAGDFAVLPGKVQSVMAAYLVTYGFSQLIYGPLSDKLGRRPVIFAGMAVFFIGTLGALFSQSLLMLVIMSAIQGLGTGVAGVMVRTMPRDLYQGNALRYANSLLNMAVLVSPLLAPIIGGAVALLFGWRACYAFLLLFWALVVYTMLRWLPETRPAQTQVKHFFSTFYLLLSDRVFGSYLMILIGALSGIAVFEASYGVLLGNVLKLNSMTVSILFILPLPAAFLGAWFAGREGKHFSQLMWHAVTCCLIAALMMWLPGWFDVINVWTLLVPAALFFFGAGMLFPLATTGAMSPFPYLAGSAGALVGGMQNLGSGIAAWFSALLPQNGQFNLGMLMFMMALLILLFWWPLSYRMQRQELAE